MLAHVEKVYVHKQLTVVVLPGVRSVLQMGFLVVDVRRENMLPVIPCCVKELSNFFIKVLLLLAIKSFRFGIRFALPIIHHVVNDCVRVKLRH